MRKMRVYIEAGSEAFLKRLADIFTAVAISSILAKGRFDVALSGGQTPRPLHRLLAISPYVGRIPWQKTRIFWVDERCVPEEDENSNYGNAKKDFLDRAPIPGRRMHPMDGTLPPETGAKAYERHLKSAFKGNGEKWPAFDLVLLGLGVDGHVASLFPQAEIREDESRWVIAVKGGMPRVDRLTMTLPVINHGKTVVFMVSGKTKAPVVKTVLEHRDKHLPAARVNPKNGRLLWVLDQEAASLIQTDTKIILNN